MTQTGSRRTSYNERNDDRDAYRYGDGSGWLWFAAIMIFLAGCHNLIYGIATLDDYAVVVDNLADGQVNIIYADTTFWGWLWIAIGIVEIIAAFALPSRNQAVRWFAIAIATINAIGQLAFLAAFPVWSIIIIVIDVLIIYGLLTWDSVGRSAYDPYPDDRNAASTTDRSWDRGYRPSAGGPGRGDDSGRGVQETVRSAAPGGGGGDGGMTGTAGANPGAGPQTPTDPDPGREPR